MGTATPFSAVAFWHVTSELAARHVHPTRPRMLGGAPAAQAPLGSQLCSRMPGAHPGAPSSQTVVPLHAMHCAFQPQWLSVSARGFLKINSHSRRPRAAGRSCAPLLLDVVQVLLLARLQDAGALELRLDLRLLHQASYGGLRMLTLTVLHTSLHRGACRRSRPGRCATHPCCTPAPPSGAGRWPGQSCPRSRKSSWHCCCGPPW